MSASAAAPPVEANGEVESLRQQLAALQASPAPCMHSYYRPTESDVSLRAQIILSYIMDRLDCIAGHLAAEGGVQTVGGPVLQVLRPITHLDNSTVWRWRS